MSNTAKFTGKNIMIITMLHGGWETGDILFNFLPKKPFLIALQIPQHFPLAFIPSVHTLFGR
jgi:hypothetical protein